MSEFSLKPARGFNSVVLKNQEATDHVFLKEDNSLNERSVKEPFMDDSLVQKL